MKKLLSIFILLVPILTAAQSTDTLYYDSKGQITDNLDSLAYYRLAALDKTGEYTGTASDYYPSGELQWRGQFISLDPEILDGSCTWYHKTGNISDSCVYENGLIQGEYISYDETGIQIARSIFENGTNIAQQIVDEGFHEFDPGDMENTLKYFSVSFDLSLSIDLSTSFLFDDWAYYLFQSEDYYHSTRLFLVAISIKNQINHFHTLALSCNYCAYACIYDNSLEDALTFLNIAIEIEEVLLGTEDPKYLQTIDNLNYVKEELKKQKENTGPSWEELSQKAMLYQMSDDFENAIIYAEKALLRAEEMYGENSENYSMSSIYLATLYSNMGEYAKAEPLYIDFRNYNEKVNGKKHEEYALSCNSLGAVYHKMGKYDEALALYREAKNILKKVVGPVHEDYASSCNSIGGIYDDMGDYPHAEDLYNEAKDSYEKIYGKNHKRFANCCNNLAGLYKETGRYSESETLYQEAKDIYKNTLGTSHPDYALSCINLGVLYHTLGNYEKAISLVEEGRKIDAKVLGTDHPNYATDCNNLAAIYIDMGNSIEALKLYNEARDIYNKTLGRDHPDYANSVNNLAGVYDFAGKHEQAEKFYKEAGHIFTRVYGKEHPSYATNCNNLAVLYSNMGRHEDALTLYQEAKNITTKILGKDHPDYALSCNNLGSLYMEMGTYSKAETMFVEANKNLHQQIRNNFPTLTEKEKMAFMDMIGINFDTYHSFALSYKDQDTRISEMSFNNALALKGLILNSTIAFRKQIESSENPSLKIDYVRLTMLRKSIINEEMKTIDERHLNIDELNASANALEKELVKELQKDGFESISNEAVKWEIIRESLKAEEAAIEFISFHFFSNKGLSDSIIYCALVLTKDMRSPEMIYLCEERELDKKLLASINETYSLENKLYSLAWEPLEIYLQDIKEVYISPSGLLHRLAFPAIAICDGQLLSDKYKINIVSSTSSLVNHKDFVINNEMKATLFGGIEYNMDDKQIKETAQAIRSGSVKFPASRSSVEEGDKREGMQYLEGTKKETKLIDLLLGLEIASSDLVTGTDAVEESFKILDGKASPEIIHIATHGFYLPGEKQENPLLHTGLMFAGANHVWSGLPDIKGVDDGILSAYEVSQLYFFNTCLVVLSACETGLGDISGSEGVFGLQRAFKMAGADYLLVSLWEVPDYETQMLMTKMYTNWLKGMEIREAFRKTQEELKEEYREDPYKWAAFVLIE